MFAWPYQDWVIKALNQNLPFNKFITWQLAGDLLKKPSRYQMVATVFNRIHSQNEEGGIVDQEYRVEYVLDRINTVSKGLMGLTLESARCHDHKYDPFSQKEYYQMSAFFNQMDERGMAPFNPFNGPTIRLSDDKSSRKLISLPKRTICLQTSRRLQFRVTTA
jgi:hypothetical protein